jgi:D-glycero-D-manno-heptose 1,7-bisphosphate phosphatase
MRAAFLDRDGVINRNAPHGDYIRSVRQMEILPGVAEAIRMLNELDFRVFVVTNQRGVSRGLMSEDDVKAIHTFLTEQLDQAGARIDAIYYCPHEEGSCECRKPATGMFFKALEDFPEVAVADSVVIGDSWRDMEAAQALGCARIFIAETVDARTCAKQHGIEAASSLLEAVERYVGGHSP